MNSHENEESHLPADTVLVTVVAPFIANADVRLPKVFGSHMVLQRDQSIPVWGWAEAGEEVTVTLGDKSAKDTADEDGKWRVRLPS